MILLTQFPKATKGETHRGEHLFFDFNQFSKYIKRLASEHIPGSKTQAKYKCKQFSACHCKDRSRLLRSHPVSSLLVIDFDCKPGNTVDMTAALSRYEGRRLLYTTPSHEADVPRFRICVPLTRTIDTKAEWRRMAGFFIEHYFREEIEVVDKPCCLDMVHLWKSPCNGATVLSVDGTPYEPYIPPAPPVKPAPDLTDMLTYPEGNKRAVRYVKATIAGVIEELTSAVEGKRNYAINYAGYGLGKLIHTGLLNEDEILSIVSHTNSFIQIAEEDGLQSALATLRSGIEGGKRKG